MQAVFSKNLYLSYFMICFMFVGIAQASGELVVVIMIKNEADVIVQTLQPYVDGGVTRMVVLDTGSTDGTIETVKTFFLQYPHIQGYIFEQPFINFAESRNYAIECAESVFKDDCFLFMPDAEWYMQNVEGLLQFCHEHAQFPIVAYAVKIRNEAANFNFYTQRLFKAHREVRFCGVVHEVINCASKLKVPDNIYISWKPSQDGCNKSCKRWARDRDILLQELEKNPDNTRYTFYLAQTYDCLNDVQNATIWYKKRCGMHGFDEEDFMAHYRLAGIYARQEQWDDAIVYYLKAYGMRPHRAEPLVHLAQHYWRNQQFALAFLFSVGAVRIPYPETDVLFIEKEQYDYARYDVLGCAAWYVQEYQLGKEAILEALKAHPDYSHLLNNLKIYEGVLNNKDI